MLRAWLITKRLRGSTLQRGFSPVEVLLAASLFGIFSVALVGALIYGRTSTAKAGDRGRAAALAEEGIEATKNIKDASYANLTDGPHGLAKSGGIWVFSGTSDVTDNFTRVVTISTIDPNRKAVVVTVTWTQGTVSRTITANSRFANWTTSLASWPNAILSGSYNAPGNDNGYKVATSGNHAYLVRNTGSNVNFIVVDISNTEAPSLVSSLTLNGIPSNITVSGNFAYVPSNSNATELQIINISNPAAPVVAGTYNAPGSGDGMAVAVSGNFAYLARLGELRIVNISTPATPTSVAVFGSSNYRDITVSGNFAYLASSSNNSELEIVNISTPASPTLAGSFNASGNTDATSIALYGSTIFIARGTEILSLNVSTPGSVSQLGAMSLSGSGNVNSLAIENTGSFLFIGSSNNSAEFRIASVSSPASMSIVKTIDVAGTASNVNGVAFSSAKTAALAASESDSQELLIYVQN